MTDPSMNLQTKAVCIVAAFLGGAMGSMAISVASEWRLGGEVVTPSAVGISIISTYGGFVASLVGLAGVLIINHSDRWKQRVGMFHSFLFAVIGSFVGVVALPFTIPIDVFMMLLNR